MRNLALSIVVLVMSLFGCWTAYRKNLFGFGMTAALGVGVGLCIVMIFAILMIVKH
jgi:hypothetical protein